MVDEAGYCIYKNYWRSLMAAILEAAAGYKQLTDMEQLIKAGIVKWISSLQVLSGVSGKSISYH